MNEPRYDIHCEYCGATPTWAVVWEADGKESVVHLCAQCDERETREIIEDDGCEEPVT